MAGEYDEKFEELTGLIKRTMGGVDEMRLEMRDLRLEVRDNTSRLTSVEERLTGVEGGVKSLDNKVDNLSAQFNAVGSMSIGDHKRVDNLEERVNVLESEVH